jgi:methylenetetrahydrofolate dehydrogenase (NADP+) / methenyltetrahydrofolate cyclohydrolase
MVVINGREIANKIEQQIKMAISKLHHRRPGLAFVLVGNNPASKVYIQMKKKKCAEVGIFSYDKELPENISQEDLIEEIYQLNANDNIDGILVQLPLPEHLSAAKIMEQISPEKDVDGFHPMNMGKNLLGEVDGFIPCTPHGIHVLLMQSQIPIFGKHVVIVGRSNIVGKPLAALLMQKAPFCNATVTVAHSCSEDLSTLCRSADILIAAMGKPKFITQDMVKPGAVVVDVGINKIATTQGHSIIVGDVDFEKVSPFCSYITPVPGGVGPMTIAMLLSNTLLSYQKRQK